MPVFWHLNTLFRLSGIDCTCYCCFQLPAPTEHILVMCFWISGGYSLNLKVLLSSQYLSKNLVLLKLKLYNIPSSV